MWYLVGIFEKSICGRPPEFCVFRSPSFSLLYHKTEQNAIGENEKNNISVSVRQRDAEPDKQDMGEMSLEQVAGLVKRDGIE